MQAEFDAAKTLLLDMDGTLLDLAFDNHFWLDTVPAEVAAQLALSLEEARQRVYALIESERGTMNWYDLAFWGRTFGLDMMALKRRCPEPIRFIDGAESFLARAKAAGFRLIIVTNSSQELLNLKDEVTGICSLVDASYSSSQFGEPKESAAFWSLFFSHTSEDPASCLLIDDSESVLRTASDFGVGAVIGIRHPDSGRRPNALDGWASVDGVRDLLL
ncbi:MAG: HAD family hydrolase [Pseudomonadota bacterium]